MACAWESGLPIPRKICLVSCLSLMTHHPSKRCQSRQSAAASRSSGAKFFSFFSLSITPLQMRPRIQFRFVVLPLGHEAHTGDARKRATTEEARAHKQSRGRIVAPLPAGLAHDRVARLWHKRRMLFVRPCCALLLLLPGFARALIAAPERRWEGGARA